jgi:hypothetical protein
MDGEQASDLVTESLDLWNALSERLGGYFVRSETRGRVRRYVLGLLSQTERKNRWPRRGRRGCNAC